jgi:hypothetical protein
MLTSGEPSVMLVPLSSISFFIAFKSFRLLAGSTTYSSFNTAGAVTLDAALVRTLMLNHGKVKNTVKLAFTVYFFANSHSQQLKSYSTV